MYQLPEIKPRRKPKAAYRKPDAVKQLEAMANASVREKYKNVESKYLSPRKYRDDTANGLTRAVIDFIRLSGGQAERINCVGRYQDNTSIVEDIIGHRRQIGSVKWLPTSGQKGTADISATIRGKSVKIEIKHGRDKQRPDQIAYQQEVERAGGTYLIIRSLQEFMEWYNKHI